MDAQSKNLGVGIHVDPAQIKAELDKIKQAIQEVFGATMSFDSMKGTVDAVQQAADEMKSIKRDLAAYQKAQDEDMTREEITLAKQASQEKIAIQKAYIDQAAQMNKAMTAENTIGNIPGGMDAKSRADMVAFYTDMQKQAKAVVPALEQVSASHQKVSNSVNQARNDILHLNEGLSGYAEGIKNLLAVQARWYGAKFVLTTVAQLPVDFVKMGLQYVKTIDDMNTAFLRWDATGGQVTPKMKSDVKGLTDAMQQVILQVPIGFKELGDVLDAFKSHGVPTATIEGMAKELGILGSSFKEIDMKTFSVSILGLFNVFKEQLPGVTDAEKIVSIIQMLLKAQESGVIRPEQFTKVAQYMGEMGNIAGLTVPQILALNIAITNTGVNASSAARLLSTFLLRLTQTKTQAALTALGIGVDMTKDFASQMDNILSQLKTKLGAGGGMQMAAVGFINTIAGAQGAKVLVPLLQNLNSINDLVQKITNSQGSLAAMNDVKVASISGQWELLKNTLMTVAKDVTFADTSMKGIVTTLLEMARGALYAIDPTLATSDAMMKLGTAGQATYGVARDLATIFSDLKTILAPLWDTFMSLTKAMADHVNILEALVALWAANKIGVMAFTAIISLMTNPMLNAAFATKSLSEALVVLKTAAMGSQLASLIGLFGTMAPLVGAAALATGGLGLAIYQINKEAKDAKDSITALTAETLKLSAGEIEANVNAQRMIVNTLQAEVDKNQDSASNAQINRINKLKDAQAQLNALMAAEDQAAKNRPVATEATPTKSTQPVIPDLTKRKSYMSEFLSATKEYHNALLSEQKSYFDEVMKFTEDFHKLGLVDDTAYYAQKKAKLTENYQVEISELLDEFAQIEAAYQKGMGEVQAGPNADKQKAAMDEKRKADLEQVNAKYIKAGSTYTTGMFGIDTDEILKNRQIMVSELQTNLDIQKTYLNEGLGTTQSAAKIQEMWTKQLYDTGGMNAKAYYDFLRSAADRNGEVQKTDLTKQYELHKRAREDEAALEGTTPERKRQLLNQQAEDDAKYQADIVKANEDTAQKIVQINIEMANSIEVIYANLGAKGAIGKALMDLGKDYNDMGKNIYTTTTNMLTGVENTTSDFLDASSTNFLNFKVFLQGLFTDISKSWSQMLTKMLMGQLTGGGDSGNSGIMGLFGKLFGGDFAGGVGSSNWFTSGAALSVNAYHSGGVVGFDHVAQRMVSPALFRNAPRLHGGLSPDEYPAILQRGETVTPKGQGQTVQHIYYINAIDTKSFAETVKRNPGAIVEVTNQNLKGNGVLRNTIRRVG